MNSPKNKKCQPISYNWKLVFYLNIKTQNIRGTYHNKNLPGDIIKNLTLSPKNREFCVVC